MRQTRVRVLMVLVAGLWASPAGAQQRFDIGLLGGWASASREGTALAFDQSTTYQANLGWRVKREGSVVLTLEIPLFATPALGVTTPGSALPKEYASLFVTPGIRATFFDSRRLAVFGLVGAGFARYSESRERVDKSANPAQLDTNTTAVGFGAGVELRDSWLGVRVEARDVVTGDRRFSIQAPAERVHNVLLSIGLAIRF